MYFKSYFSAFLVPLALTVALGVPKLAKAESEATLRQLRAQFQDARPGTSLGQAKRYLEYLLRDPAARGDFSHEYGLKQDDYTAEWGKMFINLRYHLPREHARVAGVKHPGDDLVHVMQPDPEGTVSQAAKDFAYRAYLKAVLPEFLATNPPDKELHDLYRSLFDLKVEPDAQVAILKHGLAGAKSREEYSHYFQTMMSRNDTRVSANLKNLDAVVDGVLEFGRRFGGDGKYGGSLMNLISHVDTTGPEIIRYGIPLGRDHWDGNQVLEAVLKRFETDPPNLRLTKEMLRMVEIDMLRPNARQFTFDPNAMRARIQALTYWKIHHSPELEELKNSQFDQIAAAGEKGRPSDDREQVRTRGEQAIHNAAYNLARDRGVSISCQAKFSDLIESHAPLAAQ